MGVGIGDRSVDYERRTLVQILNKIFGKEDIQGPIKRDSHLLFYPRQLKQVDRAPEPPGDEPGKVDAKNARDTGAPANRGKQTKGVESERNQILATAACDNIVGQYLTFPGSVLGRWRLISARPLGIIAQSPNAQIPGQPSTPIAALTLSRWRSFGR